MFPDEYQQFVGARQRDRRRRAAEARARRRSAAAHQPSVAGPVQRARRSLGFRLVEVGLRLAVAQRRRLPDRAS